MFDYFKLLFFWSFIGGEDNEGDDESSDEDLIT